MVPQNYKKKSFVVHMVLFIAYISITEFFVYTKNIVGIMMFAAWLLSYPIFNGCLFTHIENFFSVRKYGEKIYPNYNIKESYFYKILSWIFGSSDSEWAFFIFQKHTILYLKENLHLGQGKPLSLQHKRTYYRYVPTILRW